MKLPTTSQSMSLRLREVFFIVSVLACGTGSSTDTRHVYHHAAVQPPDGESDAVPDNACSCDCCEVEILEDTASDTRYQCAQIQEESALSFTSQEGRCRSSTCTRSPTDYVFRAAVSSEIDVQRFCFYECEPMVIKSTQRKSLQRGDICQPLKKREVEAVADRSGNGKALMEVGGSMVHFVAHKHLRAATAARAAVKASVKAPAAEYKGEWSSIADPAPEMGARATEEATTASVAAKAAAKASAYAKKVSDKTSASVAIAIKNTDATKDAASQAHDAEEDTHKVMEDVQRAAHEAAFEMIDETLKELRKQAHAEAKKEAVKKAKALQAKMLAEAPKAAVAAAKVYEDAMKRAGATAQEYAKRGDSLSAKSVSVQMEAQMLLGQSNTWISLGDNAKAEKLLQQAHQLMNEAVGLAGTANSFYGEAQGIMKTMPQYMAQAGAASYNAEIMLNPDAPPPPPPMV